MSNKPKTINSTVIVVKDQGKIIGTLEIIGDTMVIWGKHKQDPTRRLKLKTVIKELTADN